MDCKLRFPVYHNVFVGKMEALYDTATLLRKKSNKVNIFHGDACLMPDKDHITLKLESKDKCNSQDPELKKQRTFVIDSKYIIHSSGLCLAASLHHSVKLDICVKDEAAQKFEVKDKVIKNEKHQTCLKNVHHPMYGEGYVMIQFCQKMDSLEIWDIKKRQ